MMTHFRIVDVGSKIGGSAAAYNSRLRRSKFGVGPGRPDQILCIEKEEKYIPDIKKLGFKLLVADVFDLMAAGPLPKGDVYIACNVLEHLPTVEDAIRVVRAMVEAAQRGVWLILPSFEQDETGEGRLKEHGLRFNWTSWEIHPTPFRLEHVHQALENVSRPHKIFIHPNRQLKDNTHPNVVPNLDQKDLKQYSEEEHGPKPYMKFEPPIVAEWGVQIYWSDR